MSRDRVLDLFHLQYVPRWSTVVHDRPQSVAEHSFRVAVLAWHFSEALDPWKAPIGTDVAAEANPLPRMTPLTLNCVMGALMHDGPECAMGDIIAPAKEEINLQARGDVVSEAERAMCPWMSHSSSQIDPKAHSIITLCDAAEALVFIQVHGARTARRDFSISRLRQKVHALLSHPAHWKGYPVSPYEAWEATTVPIQDYYQLEVRF